MADRRFPPHNTQRVGPWSPRVVDVEGMIIDLERWLATQRRSTSR